MYVLTMNLPAEKIAEYHFSTKVLRSISRHPLLINRILAKTSPVTVHDTELGEAFETAAIEVEGSRMERVLGQVALGLYRHHIGNSWSGSFRILPEFLRFLHDSRALEWNTDLQQIKGYADDLFREAPSHGENQAVFKYQVVFPAGGPAVLRMHFYGGVKVLALFGVAGG